MSSSFRPGSGLNDNQDAYEQSPFYTEVVAVLKSVSLGREWIPGLIDKPAKRAALLEMAGQLSLPHLFVGGTSVEGLFSGTPGLVPSLDRGKFVGMVEEAERSYAPEAA